MTYPQHVSQFLNTILKANLLHNSKITTAALHCTSSSVILLKSLAFLEDFDFKEDPTLIILKVSFWILPQAIYVLDSRHSWIRAFWSRSSPLRGWHKQMVKTRHAHSYSLVWVQSAICPCVRVSHVAISHISRFRRFGIQDNRLLSTDPLRMWPFKITCRLLCMAMLPFEHFCVIEKTHTSTQVLSLIVACLPYQWHIFQDYEPLQLVDPHMGTSFLSTRWKPMSHPMIRCADPHF